MFAYCQNNPVVYTDPNGLCREVGALLTKIDCGDPNCEMSSKYEAPFFKTFFNHMKRERNNGATASVGVTSGATAGGRSTAYSSCISVDSALNYAYQKTISYGEATGEGASVGLVISVTNASNVQDLAGFSESKGGSLVILGGLAIDYITFVPASHPNSKCWGISVTIAGGGTAEAHAYVNQTYSSDSWNLWDKLDGLFYGG